MLVSFIVVAYNAGEKITHLLSDICKQDYNHGCIEIILIDGKSNDNTKQVMQKFIETNHDFSRVCILDNPKRILSCGWNIALKECRGEVILRVDAHSSISKNFISKNVEYINKGKKIVGGHRISITNSNKSWQRTLLKAEISLFGSGIAGYRRSQKEKYVSTLAHAAYSREVFQKVGGYDERLVRTEDNEMHYRMKKAGYKFYLNPAIQSYHYARNTFFKMLKQKFLNGYWIGLTLGISPFCFRIYHFTPLMFVLAIIGSVIFALNGISIPIIILSCMYIIFSILNTIISVIGEKLDLNIILLPFIIFILHVNYGIGTLIGILSLPIWGIKKKIINMNRKLMID